MDTRAGGKERVTVMSHPLTNRPNHTMVAVRNLRPGPERAVRTWGERKPVRAVPGHWLRPGAPFLSVHVRDLLDVLESV